MGILLVVIHDGRTEKIRSSYPLLFSFPPKKVPREMGGLAPFKKTHAIYTSSANGDDAPTATRP